MISKKAVAAVRRGRTSFHDYFTAAIQYEYVVDGEPIPRGIGSGLMRPDRAASTVRSRSAGSGDLVRLCHHGPSLAASSGTVCDRSDVGYAVGAADLWRAGDSSRSGAPPYGSPNAAGRSAVRPRPPSGPAGPAAACRASPASGPRPGVAPNHCAGRGPSRCQQYGTGTQAPT